MKEMEKGGCRESRGKVFGENGEGKELWVGKDDGKEGRR